MPSTIYLILRSARRARLEGRTTSMQRSRSCFPRFFRMLFRGNDTSEVPGLSRADDDRRAVGDGGPDHVDLRILHGDAAEGPVAMEGGQPPGRAVEEDVAAGRNAARGGL